MSKLDKELTFADLFAVLKFLNEKKFVVAFLFAVIAMPLMYKVHNKKTVYVTQAVVVPPQSKKSSFESLASDLGVGGAAGKPTDLIPGLIKSQKMALKIVDALQLEQYYRIDRKAAASRVRASIEIRSEKTGLMTILVKDSTAMMSAKIANESVNQLNSLNDEMAGVEAKRKREFFEKQVANVRDSLNRVQLNLKKLQQKTGIVEIDVQASAGLESDLENEKLLQEKKIEFNKKLNSLSPNNPEMIALRSEINQLKSSINKSSNNVRISRSDIPDQSLKFESLNQELKYYSSVYDNLIKQYNIAKLTEAQQDISLQMLDPASSDDFSIEPNKKIMIIAYAILSFVISLVVVLVWGLLIYLRKKS